MNIKKIVSLMLLFGLVSALFAGCGPKEEENKIKAAPVENVGTGKQFEMPAEGEQIAVMKTNMGDIFIRFFPEAAPKAVENFITHAKEGYYNGLIFHRVINDFMIQGGDPTGIGTGGESIWKAPFEDEFSEEIRNYRGALSMANSGQDTNGSQFFIVQAKEITPDYIKQMEKAKDEGFPTEVTENYKKVGGTPWLDYKHTVFGQVFYGLNIVDAIAGVQVDSASKKPVEDVVIKKIEIKKYAASDFK